MDDVSTVAQHLFSSDAFNRYEMLETEVESEGVNLFPVAFQKGKATTKEAKDA